MQSGWTTSNRVILQQLCRKTWHLTWWMTQSKRHNKTKDFWWKMYLIILEKVFLLKWNKNLFLFLINKAINTIPYVNWATSVHQKPKTNVCVLEQFFTISVLQKSLINDWNFETWNGITCKITPFPLWFDYKIPKILKNTCIKK